MCLKRILSLNFLLFIIFLLLTVIFEKEYVISYNQLFSLYMYMIFYVLLLSAALYLPSRALKEKAGLIASFSFAGISIMLLFFEFLFRIHVLNAPRHTIYSMKGLTTVIISAVLSFFITGIIFLLSRLKQRHIAILFITLAIIPLLLFYYNRRGFQNTGDRNKNIILISMDTYRYDALGFHTGNKDCVLTEYLTDHNAGFFLNHYTHSPQTNPSHATMFTSAHSTQHRVYTNAYPLSDHFSTLAETLLFNKYNTFAFISGLPMNRRISNLNQGFRVYNEVYSPGDRGFTPLRFFSFFRHFTKRRSKDTNRAVLSYLPIIRDSSFFIFLHYFCPHTPYEPPDNYRSNPYFADAEDRKKMEKLLSDPLRGAYLRSWVPEGAGIEYVKELYYGETEYLHDNIVGLLKIFEKEGLLKDTLVIITADHGESLDEHGIYFDHTESPYNTTLKVPFIIIQPNGNTDKPFFVNEITTHLDIMPTILSYAGIDKENLKNPDFEGICLLSFMKSPFHRDQIFHIFGKRNISNLITGIITDKYKVIVDKGKIEIFDLENDPREINNIFFDHDLISDQKYGPLVEKAGEVYYETLEAIKDSAPDTAINPQLKSLGYL